MGNWWDEDENMQYPRAPLPYGGTQRNDYTGLPNSEEAPPPSMEFQPPTPSDNLLPLPDENVSRELAGQRDPATIADQLKVGPEPELGTSLGGGLPLIATPEMMEKDLEQKRIRQLIGAVGEGLQGGTSFGEAFLGRAHQPSTLYKDVTSMPTDLDQKMAMGRQNLSAQAQIPKIQQLIESHQTGTPASKAAQILAMSAISDPQFGLSRADQEKFRAMLPTMSASDINEFVLGPYEKKASILGNLGFKSALMGQKVSEQDFKHKENATNAYRHDVAPFDEKLQKLDDMQTTLELSRTNPQVASMKGIDIAQTMVKGRINETEIKATAGDPSISGSAKRAWEKAVNGTLDSADVDGFMEFFGAMKQKAEVARAQAIDKVVLPYQRRTGKSYEESMKDVTGGYSPQNYGSEKDLEKVPAGIAPEQWKKLSPDGKKYYLEHKKK